MANRIGRSIALELASYDTQIVIHYSRSFVAAKKLKEIKKSKKKNKR